MEIIFVTAYDQYALEAFNVNALDYLLKPLSYEAVERTVSRLKKEKGYFPCPQTLLCTVGMFIALAAYPCMGLAAGSLSNGVPQRRKSFSHLCCKT